MRCYRLRQVLARGLHAMANGVPGRHRSRAPLTGRTPAWFPLSHGLHCQAVTRTATGRCWQAGIGNGPGYSIWWIPSVGFKQLPTNAK
jgi:hypothetical protein